MEDETYIYYRPAWRHLDEDGTLRIRVSMDDDYSTSSGFVEIPPGAKDYAFWRWVIEQERFCRGNLDAAAVAKAKEEFKRLGPSP